jgi:sulfite exporter TauE/SafE
MNGLLHLGHAFSLSKVGAAVATAQLAAQQQQLNADRERIVNGLFLLLLGVVNPVRSSNRAGGWSVTNWYQSLPRTIHQHNSALHGACHPRQQPHQSGFLMMFCEQ